ncbi:MAG: MFS family permease [Parasphingorhabdus sp.]|jgi:MFS family permease
MDDRNQKPLWSELLNRALLPKLITLCMAVWLHASNSMLTATTMPSAIAEIGGFSLISWTFALYLAGSIASAASVGFVVNKHGFQHTMAGFACVYVVGCIAVASAPLMSWLLVGRLTQGVGGGALIALVYIAQERFFPSRLIPKTVGLVSVIWTMAALSGPTIGGAFATYGSWRWAFWSFAIQGVLLIPAVYYLLSGGEKSNPQVAGKIPIFRIGFLCSAILLFSLSGVNYTNVGSPLMVLAGCVALALFIARDRRSNTNKIFPSAASDIQSPMANGLVATFILSLSIMSFLVYGPFILINLYDLSPLQAGFVVLVESLAWGFAAISLSGVMEQNEPRLIRTGSAIVFIGLGLMAIAFPLVSLWFVVFAAIFLNFGMGMMWGYIIKRLVAAAPAEDKGRASSMLPITQQTGFALGAALSGLIANGLGLSDNSDATIIKTAAFWLFAGFLPLALLGNVFAWRFTSSKFLKNE